MKAEDELTLEQKQVNALPVCPHCGQDPAIISMKNFVIGNAKAALLFCGNPECRKIFTVQVLGIEQARVVTPDGGRLLRPS